MPAAPGLDSFRCKALLRTIKAVRSRLIASRSGISIRVMRAAAEIGIRTVSIRRNECRFAAHCFEADESHLTVAGRKPLAMADAMPITAALPATCD